MVSCRQYLSCAFVLPDIPIVGFEIQFWKLNKEKTQTFSSQPFIFSPFHRDSSNFGNLTPPERWTTACSHQIHKILNLLSCLTVAKHFLDLKFGQIFSLVSRNETILHSTAPFKANFKVSPDCYYTNFYMTDWRCICSILMWGTNSL